VAVVTKTLSSPSRKWSTASLVSAVASAFLASLCCIGPLVLAALGLGGAGLLVKFERFRPHLTVVTLALLGAGFYFTYRKPKAAEGEACGCEQPKSNRFGKVMLWVATLLVIGFWTFPFIAGTLLG
jgi:mercuric ion transport protein